MFPIFQGVREMHVNLNLFAWLAVVAFFIGLLSREAQAFQLTVKSGRGVDEIVTDEDQTTLEVYSQTGICRFALSSTAETTLIISMLYKSETPYKKIEGVTVNGENDRVALLGPGQIEITIPAGNEPLKIQVIDFYR